jgi:ABC-2 type transport system permease protein
MQILGFGLTLALVAALDVYIWPSYRDTLQNFEIPPAFEALLGGDLNLSTAPGFLSAEFYSWIPILLLVYAIIQGTGAIAGEESSGTMDLVLAQPVTRRSLVIQRISATALGALAIVSVGYFGWLVSIPFVDIDVTLWDVLLANVNLLPITLLFFALALAAGAVAPTRGMAVAVTVGIATATYFVQTLAAMVDALEPLRYVSPFYYYGNGQPLVDGLHWWHISLLLGIAAALAVFATRAFEERDVTVGGATDVSLAGMLRRALALGEPGSPG